MSYVCEHAQRDVNAQFPQLMCKLMMVSEPKTVLEKATCCCGHQYFCPKTGRFENTVGCTQCSLKGGSNK